MSTTNKRLCAGTLTGTSAILYTAPSSSGAITIIKAIALCNKTAAPVMVTLAFDGVDVVNTHAIAAYNTIMIPFADQIIEAGETITGYAGSASAVNYYISGMEVT